MYDIMFRLKFVRDPDLSGGWVRDRMADRIQALQKAQLT